MTIVATIDAEIDRLETDLRTDPRFRKLSLLRGLQHEYADEGSDATPSERIAQLPAPAREKPKRGRKPKANGHAAKMAESPREKKRRTKAATQDAGEFDIAVLSAIKQLQGASKAPTFAAIEKIAGGYGAFIGKAIERLTKAGLLTPQGGRSNRTYAIHRKPSVAAEIAPPKPQTRVTRPEPEPESELEPEVAVEEVEEINEPEPQKPTRELKPLPDGYDLGRFRRAEREVLCGLFSAGEGAEIKDIATWCEVQKDHIHFILAQLKQAHLVFHNFGWQFTDLGYSVAKAVHAEECE